MKTLSNSIRKGFTLIELLVVVGILAILLAITLIAINPAKQFAQANDTKRSSDVNAILNAVGQYSADNKGNINALGITATPTVIGGDATTTPPQIDLCAALVTEYMAALPVDPLTNNGAPVTEADCTTDYNTGYMISRSATDNRVTVTAPATEVSTTDISVTR